jgi:hypothetical protein
MEVVHVRHRYVTPARNEVATEHTGLASNDLFPDSLTEGCDSLCHQNRGHRAQEDGVTTKEGKELLSRSQDFPL